MKDEFNTCNSGCVHNANKVHCLVQEQTEIKHQCFDFEHVWYLVMLCGLIKHMYKTPPYTRAMTVDLL